MQRNVVVVLWIVISVVAVIVSIVGWVMGDLGLGFAAFLVRWIVPIGILVGFGYYRSRVKS